MKVKFDSDQSPFQAMVEKILAADPGLNQAQAAESTATPPATSTLIPTVTPPPTAAEVGVDLEETEKVAGIAYNEDRTSKGARIDIKMSYDLLPAFKGRPGPYFTAEQLRIFLDFVVNQSGGKYQKNGSGTSSEPGVVEETSGEGKFMIGGKWGKDKWFDKLSLRFVNKTQFEALAGQLGGGDVIIIKGFDKVNPKLGDRGVIFVSSRGTLTAYEYRDDGQTNNGDFTFFPPMGSLETDIIGEVAQASQANLEYAARAMIMYLGGMGKPSLVTTVMGIGCYEIDPYTCSSDQVESMFGKGAGSSGYAPRG